MAYLFKYVPAGSINSVSAVDINVDGNSIYVTYIESNGSVKVKQETYPHTTTNPISAVAIGSSGSF